MPPRSDKLTPRQLDLCHAIDRFRDQRGFGPSLLDLAKSLQISVSGTKALVGACVAKGAVAAERGTPRSIRTIRPDAAAG